MTSCRLGVLADTSFAVPHTEAHGGRLMEINRNPSLDHDTALDVNVKMGAVGGALRMVNPAPLRPQPRLMCCARTLFTARRPADAAEARQDRQQQRIEAEQERRAGRSASL